MCAFSNSSNTASKCSPLTTATSRIGEFIAPM